MAVALTSLPAVIAGDSGEIANANTIHTAVNALTAEMQGGVMNLRAQVGVVGDGSADDATAINSAAVSAAALGVQLYATGTFKIGSTVTITCDADLGAATFNYTGSTVAVQLGGATIMTRKSVILPEIIYTPKSGTGWTASTVGVKAINTQRSEISITHIRNFETGYLAYGQGAGNQFNTIKIRHLDNNKRNEMKDADATGWVNQNTYIGGSCSHDSAEGSSVSGVRHSYSVSGLANPINNNRHINVSYEGDVPEYQVDIAGSVNVYDSCRWEVTGGARVRWQADATDNLIWHGYKADLIVPTTVGGALRNKIQSGNKCEFIGTSSVSVVRMQNTSSDAVYAMAIYGAASIADTDYRWRWSANQLDGKRVAETGARVILDGNNGRLYLGTGGAAPTMYFSATSTSGLTVNTGNLYSGTDNTYELGLISSLRFKYIRAATAVVTGAAATGSRPAAATAGAGAMFFDTTLVIPIWSDGTTWRNASGTAV